MSTFVTRVRLRNYKSIAKCDVELGELTLLVGRNGSGKSNFLDAIRFVVDGLSASLDHAIKSRGGIDAVRRKSTGHPNNFGIELELQLSEHEWARYGFEIAAQKQGGFILKSERLSVFRPSGETVARFRLVEGQLVTPADNMPASLSDRLYLVNASGLPQFRPVYDALLAMGFYNLNPEAMKELQSPDAGELLHRDGSNVASVVARLAKERPKTFARIQGYLSTIVPGVRDVERVQLGPKETLKFKQEIEGAAHPWQFFAASMSDGTLRALGALIAVSQVRGDGNPARLIGIEEPEAALHPFATGALMDALREAATQTQVLVTTHSPDLLDRTEASDRILVVASHQGRTEIAPADPASREAIHEHLHTPGDLLRIDQLEPDAADLARQSQMRLFDEVEEVS